MVQNAASKRSLRSLRLTRAYHYRYLGLWMMVTIALMVVCNLTLYLWLQERFASGLGSLTDPAYSWSLQFRQYLGGILIIETLVFAIGIVALGKLTAHRIAGPYLRIQKTCEAVRDGDDALRLQFRDYDGLQDLARTFNEMVDAVRGRSRGGG